MRFDDAVIVSDDYTKMFKISKRNTFYNETSSQVLREVDVLQKKSFHLTISCNVLRV
jgi:hypothetical protein